MMKGVSVPDWLCFVRPSDRTLRFSATTLGASMLSTLFYTYYIPLFLKSWGLTYGWFYAGQTLFMVWNAVNDPLFGWIQDNPSAPRQDNIRTYSRAIYLGGPLFALATLLPWWPWVEPFSSPAITGLHFIVSLFLFDGLFTYVVLAQCGLFADIEESQEGRSDVVATSQFAQMIGSLTTFISYPLWEQSNAGATSDLDNIHLGWFRLLAIVISAVAAACFYYTGRAESYQQKQVTQRATVSTTDYTSSDFQDTDKEHLEDPDSSGVKHRNKAAVAEESHQQHASWPDDKPDSLLTIYKQVITNSNFIKFVITNFLQIFNNTFNGNFYAEFMTAFFGSKEAQPLGLGANKRGMMLGATNFLPPLFTIVLTPVVKKLGHSYHLVKRMFLIKVVAALLVGLFASPTTIWGLVIVALFMVLHKSFSATTFNFFNMSVSDLIDDDMKRNNRNRRLGSTFFGLNALFTTPAVSAAPMLTVAFLSRYGYRERNEETDTTAEEPAYSTELREAMWSLTWIVPLVCGIIQIVVWNSYSLRGEKSSATNKQTDTTGSP